MGNGEVGNGEMGNGEVGGHGNFSQAGQRLPSHPQPFDNFLTIKSTKLYRSRSENLIISSRSLVVFILIRR